MQERTNASYAHHAHTCVCEYVLLLRDTQFQE